jgi:DNA-binding response OmpR family regulator
VRRQRGLAAADGGAERGLAGVLAMALDSLRARPAGLGRQLAGQELSFYNWGPVELIVRDSLRRRFHVVATTNGFEALRMMVAEPFPVVLSDMRMPRINGARFLTLARDHAPDTVRLLLTGQSTLDEAVTAVNEGQVFRVLVKPCPTRELIAAIDSAIRHHASAVEERRVGEQLLDGALHALTEMAATIDPTAPARSARVRKLAVELARAVGITYALEIGRACELLQLGAVSLPAETRAHLAGGRPATAEHAAQLEALAANAVPFLERIPRLEIERTVLSHAALPFVPTRPGEAGTPIGARVLRIVLDYDVLVTQGMADHLRLDAMRARQGTYDPAVLAKFDEMLSS